jgi:SET domain-containing protein
MPNDAPLRVRASPIAGQGAFASRAIACGERIIEYAGERITEAEFQRRDPVSEPGTSHHNVFFEVKPDVVIDANVDGNEARFINHSCDPNCETRLEDDRVQIYARRDIRLDEELCFDYGYVRQAHHTPAMLAAHPCRCGSATCRGTLFKP